MTSKQVVSIIINIFLVLNQTITAAELTVDTGAPKGNQAELLKAPNGVPIVNIVTPNSQGLSHNKFSNFNVDPQGLVLNNSKTIANTQLAGYISYNPNLTGNNAKLILNEVTGTSKTLLRGYTEVAGVAADVIVANPNGISVNGGGFINTPNATLTTGTPIMNGNVLQGFNVGGGNILIDGDGFNGNNIAKVNLYAKALQLNAKLYADELSIVTGENNIALDGTVSSKGKSGSGISIDSSMLGGIYANTITLKSTDKGIGVNLPPEVLAQNSLELSADGNIIASKVISNAQTTITSNSGNINLVDDVSANGIIISAQKDISIAKNKLVQSYKTIDVSADNIINQGELSVVEGTGQLNISGKQTITNEGLISGYDINFQSTAIENKGNIYSKHYLAASSKTLDNSASIQSNGAIDFWIANSLTNQKNGSIISYDLLSIAQLNGIDAIQKLTNEGLVNGQDIGIKADNFNNSGSFNSKGQFVLTSKTLNNSGTINSANTVMISAETIDNTGEFNALSGTGKSSITALQNINNEGLIGGYDMDIKANSIDNTGAMYSKNNLAITAQTLDNAGLIRSNKAMDLLVENSLTNQKEGVIYSDDTLNIAANSAKDKINTVTNKGLIQSETNINITAKTLTNTANAPVMKEPTSSSTITVGGGNDFDIVTTNVYKKVIDVPSDPALIIAAGDINLNVGTLNNVYSLISSDGNIVLNATLVNNIGVLLVTTTDIITSQYRNEKTCTRRPFRRCRENPAYRGTYTQSETIKNPVANYGIQAKKSISGNVVTLNNISSSTNPQIQAKLTTIDSLEGSSKSLQSLTKEITNTNDSASGLFLEEQTLTDTLTNLKTLDDLATYKTELASIKTDIQDVITQNSASITSLESVISTIKTLNAKADTSALDATITTLKDNYLKAKTQLDDFETLYISLKVVADAQTKKTDVLTVQTALSDLLTQNTTALQSLNVEPITTGLENIGNTLRAEVNVALAQQGNGEFKIITANEGLYQTNTHNALSKKPQVTYTANSSTIIDNIILPKGKYGTFLVDKTKDHPYLIEANPLYTNYNTFVSSDYMLKKLDYRPEKTLKRLGDAMYETQLVSNSVIRLSGGRYLPGYGSELAQFQGLMDNAINLQASLDLKLGISLSAEQISRLNKNIVWMVEKVVDGETVLVPEVYLSSDNVTSDGAKIAAGEIDLVIQDTLLNEGIIASEGTLKVATGSKLTNQNGVITSGGTMVLASGGALENLSGTIQSGGDMSLQSQSITSTALTQDKTYNYEKGYQTITEKGKAAQFTSGGNLAMQTKDDITLANTNVQATESIIFSSSTNGAVNVETVETKENYDFRFSNGYNKGNSITNHASSVDGKNITINANQINVKASSIAAQENMTLKSKTGVNILAANDYVSQETQIKTKGGLFGGKSVKKDESSKSTVVGSTLSAKDLNIDTKSLSIQGSKLTAEQAVIASEIIELISLKNSDYESHFSDKSGLMTRTIVSKGHVKEEVVPALIEVRNQLIVNNKDVTKQLLQTDNLMKTITSQSGLSVEQIKLVEAYAKSDEWNKKMTTLSGMGSLIIAAVVTVCTMGAGAGLAAGMVQGMNMAASAATQAAIQSAIQAAIHSLVVQATTSLVTAAITGNSPVLDANALIKGAVLAGVTSMANTTFATDALKDNMGVYDYAKNAVVRGTVQGVSSEISGGEFKDGFTTGAALSIVNDGALQMRQYVKENFDYAGKNGEPVPDNVKSVGVNGDGVKVEGSHPEKVVENGVIIRTKEVIAPTGGAQMGENFLFGMPVVEGSVTNKTLAYFAGPHDFLSSWNYENINIDGQTLTVLKDNGTLVNVASGALLIPALPLAAAPFIQNNINEINTINYIREQEKKKAEDFILTNTKDTK